MKWTFLLIACFIAHASAIRVWVDADTGALTLEQPTTPGLWPNGHGACTESLDAQYMEHDGRYEVWEQIYFPQDYGQSGELATVVNIYDLKKAAVAMHERGVWHANWNCNFVTTDFNQQIVKPLLAATQTQRRSTLTSRLFGFVLEMRCRGPKDFVVDELCDEEDRSLCKMIPQMHNCKDGNEMMMIAQGRVGQIHAIRADAERRYK